jgi:predicted metal-dependent hydrolase
VQDKLLEDNILSGFSEGIKKFNCGDFFECHDILEDVWFEIRGHSRRFYQGLIHLAVGFYHIQERNNPKGALSQLNKGIVKLKEYVPEYQGVELKQLLKKIDKCIHEIEQIRENKTNVFDEVLIPKINFNPDKFKNVG